MTFTSLLTGETQIKTTLIYYFPAKPMSLIINPSGEATGKHLL